MTAGINIWEEAIKEKNALQDNSHDITLIVLGSHGVGKTTLLKILRGETPQQTKPTCIIDYSFIRRKTDKKDIVHCYEIADQIEVLPSLVTKENYPNIRVAICIDLSKPSKAIEQIGSWISAVRKQFSSAVQDKPSLSQKHQEMLMRVNERMNQHEDRKFITPSVVSIAVVGCKYDLFEKYDTQNRKWFSRTLRFMAHINCASLYFSSNKHVAVNLKHALLESDRKPYSLRDHLSAILIDRGLDTISSMNIPTSGSLTVMDVLRKQMGALFKGEEEEKKQGLQVSRFVEKSIDDLIENKKQEIIRIAKIARQSDLYSRR